MTIKHFCLCGGGIIGVVIYGIIKRLNQLKIWELKNIETIYCTSIGSIIGLVIILDIPWEWLDDFWIKRPWHTVFNFINIDYFKLLREKGIFDETNWVNYIKPLLKCKNLKEDITLLELYEYRNIELNIYTTEMNGVTKKILNYKTYPDMRLTYAIYLSACIPYMFKPAYFENNYYIDGGLTNNSPINDCLYNNNCNEREIINIINEKNDNINFDYKYTYKINKILDETINTDIKDNINSKCDNIDRDNIDRDIDNNIDDNNADNENIYSNDVCGNNTCIKDDIYDSSSNNTNKKINQDISTNIINNYIIDDNINQNSDIFSFSLYLLKKLVKKIIFFNTMNNINIYNTINACIISDAVNINTWITIMYNSEYLINTINYGCILAEEFYSREKNG